jgi:tetratricopeptide (TPR) repeat protein
VTSERARLIERRDVVRRDLLELAVQRETGEVASDTAERLRRTYESELDALDSAIEELPDEEPERSYEEPPTSTGRGSRLSWRRVVGSLVFIGILVVAFVLVSNNANDTGQPVGDSPGDLTVDPASVSNEELEAVVAANPKVNGMRMALADRYFAAEEYGSALDHYLILLENNPSADEESKALARIAWIAYRTGLAEAAEEYARSSLEVDPNNSEAKLYIGFITFYGLGDAEAAIPQLEAALEIPNLSENVISQIEDALEAARGDETP